VRFLIAKELFKHLCRAKNTICARFANAPAEVQDIQANVFAGLLLVPGRMLRKEVESIDSSIDIVLQLAETFWTSKALMNQRLRDYMEHLS
jgi:Zn-dependent peptidase ImmA (M78 family)